MINQNTVETSGIDLNVDWRRDLAGGQYGVRLLATYVDRYAGTATDGSIIDVVGTDGGNVAGVGTNPQIRANVIQTFSRGNHSARWSARFTDGTKLRNPGAFEYNTSDASWTQHDVVYTYTLRSGNELNLAALNILDNEPPLQANTLTTVNSSLYDPRGRMWRILYEHRF